jgi:hypothetical protein
MDRPCAQQEGGKAQAGSGPEVSSNPDARKSENRKRKIRDSYFQLEGIAGRPADVSRRLICAHRMAHKPEDPAQTDRNHKQIEQEELGNSPR